MKKTVLTVAALLLAPQLAWAHAHLKEATPAADQNVASPASISASFTESLEPAFSSLNVSDAKGQAVDLGKAALSQDNTLVLTVKQPLSAGSYTVNWNVLSKDGHKTKGKWSFTVQP